MTITDRERELIMHALGLRMRRGRPPRWAYRNYYAAGRTDAVVWRQMEQKGFARQIALPGSLRPYHTFEVTHEGVDAAEVRKYVPLALVPRP